MLLSVYVCLLYRVVVSLHHLAINLVRKVVQKKRKWRWEKRKWSAYREGGRGRGEAIGGIRSEGGGKGCLSGRGRENESGGSGRGEGRD